MSLRLLALLLVATLGGGCTNAAYLQGGGAAFQGRVDCPDAVTAQRVAARLRSDATLQAIRAYQADSLFYVREKGSAAVSLRVPGATVADEQRAYAHSFWERDDDWQGRVLIGARAAGRRVDWSVDTHVVGFDPDQNHLLADLLGLRANHVLSQIAREARQAQGAAPDPKQPADAGK